MEKSKVTKFKARIKKANNSFSVMGDMLLCLEIDAMTREECIELKAAIAPVTYKYLDSKIQSEAA